jgi:hypothetical protein
MELAVENNAVCDDTRNSPTGIDTSLFVRRSQRNPAEGLVPRKDVERLSEKIKR